MLPWRHVQRFLLALFLALGQSTLDAAAAHAHPIVEEGRRLYEEADFTGALDAFARAEAAGNLTHADLVTMLEVRVLVHVALGQADAWEADLERIASIAPDHRFPQTAPPDLVDAFAHVRAESPGPIRVSVDIEASARGVSIEAAVHNDVGDLVRDVQIFGVVRGGEWLRAVNGPLFVPGTEGQLVDYYVECVGPGGVVLARLGRRTAPRAATVRDETVVIEQVDGGGSAWPWIAVGAGVAAVAGVILAVILATSSERTWVGEWQIDWDGMP